MDLSHCKDGAPRRGHEPRLRRTLLWGTLLIALLLCTQEAFADGHLLRGPRKAPRATAEPPAASQGLLEGIASAPVLFYQRFLGPHWGQSCAYYPSCSHYALLAIRRHGAWIGSVMAFDRLQHEANEGRFAPQILAGGEIKVNDPLENNDFWWYKGNRSEGTFPASAEKDPKP